MVSLGGAYKVPVSGMKRVGMFPPMICVCSCGGCLFCPAVIVRDCFFVARPLCSLQLLEVYDAPLSHSVLSVSA